MRRDGVQQITAYVLVGLLSVGGAFMVSLKFLGRTHAQGTRPSQPPQAAPKTTPATPPPAPAAEEVEEGTDTSESADDASASEVAPKGEASELEGFLEPFIYDVVNRRDPFMPYAEYTPETPGNSRPLTPAQRFDLDQLKLVGIMWDVKDPKAMFMDPESEVLVLGRDEGIGNRSGYIAAIREGEVVVVEALRRRGDIIYKTKVLRIER